MIWITNTTTLDCVFPILSGNLFNCNHGPDMNNIGAFYLKADILLSIKNMKTIIVLIVTTVLSLCVNAQEFMGIKVDGSRQEILSKFKAKGFTYSTEKKNVIVLSGDVGGREAQVFCSFTPKSGKCWKITVFMPEQTSWYSLKSEYEKYVGIMTEKYGKADKSYEFFSSPYYEGDGYELTAVQIEKCTFASFWGVKYSVQISKFKQVKIGYENPVNSKLDDDEKEENNSKIF